MRVVYLTGSSGVGKSTLASYIGAKYNLPILTGATRIAREKLNLTFEQILADPDVAAEYQKQVWQSQLEIEEPYWNGTIPGGFVSDRCFDLLAYTADNCRAVSEIARQSEFSLYVRRLRNDSVVFFIRPTSETLQKARDGRRDMFLEIDCVHRIDGAIQMLLNLNDIPYIPVSCSKLLERQRLVDGVLDFRFGRQHRDQSRIE